MSYTIEPIPLKEFIKDNDNYKLPRYQRQERWDHTRNFELAISIFQNYPIGVVIIDERKGQNWLLDGRQRRNALEKIVNDPTTLYWWARRCIRFTNNSLEEDVHNAFWNKVDSFAQKEEEKDDDNETNTGTSDDTEENVDDEVGIEEAGKMEKSQHDRLQVLLDLIWMVHKCKPSKEGDKWEDTFDFRGGNINTGYCSKSKGIDIPLLKDFIIKYANLCEKEGKQDLTKESFRQYCEDTFNLENNAWLENTINSKWDRMRSSILAIKASDQIFDRVQIGAIKLKNVAFFDSLNIFSRVNSKGVPLKVEELLSANPFWNKPVEKVDHSVKEEIREMYRRLELTRLEEYVRWDVVATLIPRLGRRNRLVLKQDENSGNFLGFKLLSSIYANGMSKRHLADLEQKAEEMFGDDGTKIDELVEALKDLLRILKKDDFFARYIKGQKTLQELLGHAPALEFITILYRSWDKKGRRKYEKDSEATMELQQEARILFDRLVYEQLKGEWKGSGDSRMSRHIVDWEARLREDPIPYSEWEEVLIPACRGTLTPLNVKRMLPVLYYSETLRDRGFPAEDNPWEEPYDVDHIFPQKKLKNKILNKSGNNKDCLANLELLSQSNNRSKSDTRINELDEHLRGVVARATGLRQEDIEDEGKYSDPDIDNGFKRLISDREEILLELFRTKRSKFLGITEED